MGIKKININNTLWKTRFNRYTQRSIRSIRKEANDYYRLKFNPFHEWKIGALSESEIKEEIVLFSNNKSNSEKVLQSESTRNAFALLWASYNEIIEEKDFNANSDDFWREVRKRYEENGKKEFETTLGSVDVDKVISKISNSVEESSDEIWESIVDVFYDNVNNNNDWHFTKLNIEGDKQFWAAANLALEKIDLNKICNSINSYLEGISNSGNSSIESHKDSLIITGWYKVQ